MPHIYVPRFLTDYTNPTSTERLNDILKNTPLHFLETNICVIFINQILWENTDSLVLKHLSLCLTVYKAKQI